MVLHRSWRVLLIDDSEIAVELETELLVEAGFEVRGVTDVESFDEQLEAWTPEVILTDVKMPGVTGVELCRMLKRRYETAHVPIVLCSSLGQSELAELARECEADGFISKEDGLDQLADELRALCEATEW